MAIFAWPVGTQPDSTLMGQVLPSLIKNRVGFGFFFKKKLATSLGFNKTWRVPDPTIYLSTKIPSYIYSNKTYHLILISFHIFNRLHSPLPVSLSFPLLSSPLLSSDHHSHNRASLTLLSSHHDSPNQA